MSITVAVSFDMRSPAFGAPTKDLYAAALDMATFADEIGVDRIGMMEHHASEDGYLPQPFVLGGGIAARTKRARLNLGAVILPLHDPVKVAEQIAVLDLMSNGRLHVVFGAGYVPSEFAMFGVSLRDRGRLMDEGVDIILRALRGERFEANGRPVFVRPLPVQRPEDIILIGGGVEASAKRAARLGLGFAPLRRDLIDLYKSECAAHGHKPGHIGASSPGMPISVYLTEDPERAWSIIEPHALHVVKAYAAWADEEKQSNSPFKGLLDRDALRASGIFAAWTPEELLRNAAERVQEHGGVGFQPLLGGLSPEEGWKSLELLKKTLPKLKALKLASS